MLVSLDWLREFVPYEGEPQELGDRLTMLGLELEEIADPFEAIETIVVGHVLECDRHPEAEKLSVCKVDVGDETLEIVCGAPNVAKGQKVPVAKVGTVMPGGMKIKKAKLRGVRSVGMICSEAELGVAEKSSGIWVLPDELKPGHLLVEALGLDRVVFDFDITPNRSDCLSILGVAREAALAFDLPLTMPKLNLKESGGDASSMVRIDIQDGELCPLYQARIIQGVDIKPSPDWMRFRLLAMGVRPISNIVDVTNYILMELGQPMHAFDNDLLRGGVIRVAPATDGLKLTTLDGQERKLSESDLVIWDGDGPVALAGVMGGLSTEINDKSRDVLLECAIFKPAVIRKTARRQALPSEASYRFERGVDQVAARFAVDRGAQLMAELAGGSVVSGISLSEPKPWQDRSHRFRRQRCNSLLGIDLSAEFCRKSFTLMGCEVDDGDAEDWKVASPSHRLDLEREADLYEEVARVYGMDRIPAVLPRVSKALDSRVVSESEYGFLRSLKNWAAGVGLHEAINYSFVGDEDLDLLGLEAKGRIPIANPLSADQNVMRTRLAPGLLSTLKQNIAQGNNSLRIFEVAKIFLEDSESMTTAREHVRLGLMAYGGRFAQDWPWPAGDADYLDVKGLVEHLLDRLKLGPAQFKSAGSHPYLEPCVDIYLEDKSLGCMGRVRPETADKFHARKEVWMAELDADLLRELHSASSITFSDLPKFPPIRRDMTAISPATLRVEQIESAVRDIDPPFLKDVVLTDVYLPEDNPDERNLTFRLTYRHDSKTLKDKEVDKAHAKVISGLLERLPVRF